MVVDVVVISKQKLKKTNSPLASLFLMMVLSWRSDGWWQSVGRLRDESGIRAVVADACDVSV